MTEMLGRKDKIRPLKYETIIDLAALHETDLSRPLEGLKKNKECSRYNISQVHTNKGVSNHPKETKLVTKTPSTDHGKTGFQTIQPGFKDKYIAKVSSVHQDKVSKKRGKHRRLEMSPYKHDIRVEMTPSVGGCKIREEETIRKDTFDIHQEGTMRLDRVKEESPEETIMAGKLYGNTERAAESSKRQRKKKMTIRGDTFCVVSEGTMRGDKFDSSPEGTLRGDKFDSPPEGTMREDKFDFPPEGTLRGDKFDSPPEGTLREDKFDFPPGGTMRENTFDFPPGGTMRGDTFEFPPRGTMRGNTFDFSPGRTMGGDQFEYPPHRKLRQAEMDSFPETTMRQDNFAVLPAETMSRDQFGCFPERTTRGDKCDAVSKPRKSRDKLGIHQDSLGSKNATKTKEDYVNYNLGQEFKRNIFSEFNTNSVNGSKSAKTRENMFPLSNPNHSKNTNVASSHRSGSSDVSTYDNERNKNNNATDIRKKGAESDSPRSQDMTESNDSTTTDNTTIENTESTSETAGTSEDNESSNNIAKKGSSSSLESPDTTDKSEMETSGSSSSLQSGGGSEDGNKGSSEGDGKKRGSGSSSSSGSIRKKIKKRRGFFMKMLKSSPEEHMLLKVVIWFPVGIGISVLLYFMIVQKMNLDEKYKAIVGSALGLVLSLTFAFSVQMRCMMTLVVPSFVGKAGRSYFAAFAIVYLINGPITNIMENCKEVVRGMTCNTALSANHTKVKWMLRLHPVENALGDLMKDNFLVAKMINKAFKPLRKEIVANKVESDTMEKDIKKVEKSAGTKTSSVDGIEKKYKNKEEKDEAGKKIEKAWEKKLDLRCQGTFANGVQKCKDKMGELWDKCLDKLWILGYLLCWPLKITLFCLIIKLIPGILGTDCDAVAQVSPGFGETYLSAQGVMSDMETGANVNMQYKIVGNADADYTPVEEMRQGTIYEVKAKTESINIGLNLITHFLTFTFLLIFYGAYKYNKKYLSDYNWDNNYITPYFRHIDARRKDRGKKTLLPLKKAEKKEFYDPNKIKLGVAEKKAFIKGTSQIIMKVLISAIIIYMDSMFYQVLDIIARNSKIEYHQTGEHIVDIKVYGRGFMSALVRSFLEKFNSKQTLDSLTTNYDCLPRPYKTDIFLIASIYGTYFMVWLFMYFQAFGLRMRRVIAAFYYRKREKKRVLFLYNEMYRKRIGFLEHMRKKVRKALKKREYKKKVGLLLALKQRYPKLSKCLSIFKSTKETCLICGDDENKEFYNCPTEGCGVKYCRECWIDISKKCYACGQTDTEEDDIDSETSENDDTSNEETE